MASKEKKSGGDFVLESRHLVGLFMLLVVIFGVVFTLGYTLGRSQYDTGLLAAAGKPHEAAVADATPKAKAKPDQGAKTDASAKLEVEDAPRQNKSDWDFYHSAEPKTSEDHLQPVKKNVSVERPAPASRPATVPVKAMKSARSSAPLDAPLIPKGTIMLQVAAVQSQGDALALAQALQQKKFPAFVITPSTDKYYRVQVGPYVDNKAATAARSDLEAKGFKSIVKR